MIWLLAIACFVYIVGYHLENRPRSNPPPHVYTKYGHKRYIILFTILVMELWTSFVQKTFFPQPEERSPFDVPTFEEYQQIVAASAPPEISWMVWIFSFFAYTIIPMIVGLGALAYFSDTPIKFIATFLVLSLYMMPTFFIPLYFTLVAALAADVLLGLEISPLPLQLLIPRNRVTMILLKEGLSTVKVILLVILALSTLAVLYYFASTSWSGLLGSLLGAGINASAIGEMMNRRAYEKRGVRNGERS